MHPHWHVDRTLLPSPAILETPTVQQTWNKESVINKAVQQHNRDVGTHADNVSYMYTLQCVNVSYMLQCVNVSYMLQCVTTQHTKKLSAEFTL